MSESGLDVQAQLDAWRAQGADRVDPLGFVRIDALARRARLEHGAIRDLLDMRLAELVDAYASRLIEPAPRRDDAPGASAGRVHPGSALTALLEQLAQQPGVQRVPADAEVATGAPAGDRFADVRRLCGHARADSQLRQALEEAPQNAGPLNSASLVHRALTLMRDVSPEYLQPFMAYVDALAWLETMNLDAGKAAPVAGSSAKAARGKGRGRRSG